MRKGIEKGGSRMLIQKRGKNVLGDDSKRLSVFFQQQQQRPDLTRLIQLSAQAQVAPGGPAGAAGLPPGLLAAGHPAGVPVSAPPGLPNTLSLLAGIPTSLAQQVAGNPAAVAAAANLPHPAFASLLAQQKPGAVHEAIAKAKEEELKRVIETNGGKRKKYSRSLTFP